MSPMDMTQEVTDQMREDTLSEQGESLRRIAGTNYCKWKKNAADLADLLRRKHEDYGPGNIMASGHTGIAIRLSDKMARLENMMRFMTHGEVSTLNAASPNFESIQDTYMDIAGYALIGVMLLNGDFPPESLNTQEG